MTIGKILGAAASLSLIATPVAAQAVAAERQPAPVSDSEDIRGVPTLGWLVALIIAAGVIVIIADDDDEAESP